MHEHTKKNQKFGVYILAFKLLSNTAYVTFNNKN